MSSRVNEYCAQEQFGRNGEEDVVSATAGAADSDHL